MSKYNETKTITATVTTHQGGQGFQHKPEHELMSLLANGISNTFYEKETDQDKRLVNAIQQVDPELVAKMLVYTRAVLGQRSVTHRGAVALLSNLTGKEWGKFLFSKRDRRANFGGLIYRLDDMLEITACYFAHNPGKPLPNALRKGFKSVLENSDEYSLAKYQGKDKKVSLVDLVNLVRPKPQGKEQEELFKKLMTGGLKQFNTVEDKNTKAGQDVAAKVKAGELDEEQAKVELSKAKEDNFKGLIEDKIIGYLALLRNLRNILLNTKDQQLIKDTCTALTNQTMIQKSLVFPHQIDLALEVLIDEFKMSVSSDFVTALNSAYELAIPNLSEIGAVGKTAVVFDSSGSMTTKIEIGKGKNGSQGAIDKASLIAATLAKGIKADVYTFDTSCRVVNYNPSDSINTIKNNFRHGALGGGTDFGCIFNALNQHYDRVFIISDMQGSDDISRASSFQAYKSQFGEPYIYCINLCGYATTMFNPNNKKIAQIFGYSAEIYEIIKKVEIDYNVLLNDIKAINIYPKNYVKKV